MESLDNHGIILRELRKRNGLSIQKVAVMIQKSPGWLCEVENAEGTCRLSASEFDRIVGILGGSNERHMFKTWIANYKNQSKVSKFYDGAVIKYIRLKKGISLSQAARKVGLSKGYLSKLETGAAPMTLERRCKLMKAYGYNPTSFKNLSSDPVRSKAVPLRFKFDILLQKLSTEAAEMIFQSALSSHS
jgi:transcriptional regulator with XRE-family HTH domain